MTRNVESIFGAVVTAPHQIPYTYTATGGETFISLPFYPVTGVITINGGVQVPVDNYNIDGNTVNLGRALEAGDVVYCLFDKILSPEDYENGIRVYKFVAVGNETSFTPDFSSYGIQTLFIDGEYKISGVDYFYNSVDGSVTLATPPTAGVWVVAEMSVKQPNISPVFDRTIQEVGRSANAADAKIILSTDTISVLDAKTVIYDAVAQKSWGKPSSVPAGAKIVSVTGSTLVYNPGGVSVTMIPVPGSADELSKQLIADTGSDKVHYKQLLASAVERSLTSHLYEQVSVKDFGAKGDWDPVTQTGTDDSLAFRAAVKTVAGEVGRNVYVPPGNYLVTRAEMSSNVRIFGAGAASSLYQDETLVGVTSILGTNFDGAGSADWSLNTVNIAIDNIRFVRKNRNTYVSSGDVWQHYHLVYIGATTKFAITNCTFEGFNGDGVYIAGGFGASIERHNLDGLIFNCQFTGVDNQNRNGISVIDCEGLIIANNVFRNCTNQYQPGPIDIEPNPYVFHRIRDIKIVGNRFVLCRGVSAGLNVYFPDVAYTSQPLGILFAENEVDSGSTTNTCVGLLAVFEGDATPARNVNLRAINNRFTRCLRGFNVTGMRNIRIEDNEFTEMRMEALLGFGAAGKKNMNVTIKNNLFYNVGYEDGRGLGVYDIDGLIIDGNTFRDVGKGTDPRAGEAIIFKSGRTGVKINITDNVFINEGRLVTAAISSAGYTFDPSTNTFANNTFLGGITAWTFPAVFGNNAEYTWTPVVYGDTTDGVGTYTLQKGSYHIEGGVVHFRMQCTLTAHTGSGPMNLTLPTKAAVNGVNQIALGYIVGNIASVSGLSACRIDGALKGAVGRIRIYRYDASGNINISSAGTSLSVEISGTYPYQP